MSYYDPDDDDTWGIFQQWMESYLPLVISLIAAVLILVSSMTGTGK